MLKNRHSIRLKGYDYAKEGAYFLTICAEHKQKIFGVIVDGQMKLNALGQIVHDCWSKTSLLRPNTMIDEFMIMPDHFHAIVFICDRRGVCQYAPTQNQLRSPSQTIGAIVRGFKSMTTQQINIIRQTPYQSVWQRNYYERIIRNDDELHEIRQYIQNNPLTWETDINNPQK